ncbi:DNA cytosine methyltransferase [Thioalkalivibrio sp. ALE6]|uniref:DNA cytosine methyltransferase n=1 Tax=Thioalkalivibrio sp. ALE6 TaxID=1266908 RepID=UPI00035F9B8E|nr:DNA cytosine methyltransferase [Thioalkalivibrio sp. ALE6]
MSQMGLDLGHEIVVDLFAGGGGASEGIEQALGRPVDVAVNHDPDAVVMHQVNHPGTTHFCESVFRVDPCRVTGYQPVGLLWASPDCTHHSKAKGGKPVSNKRRGLAWVVVKWARRVRPRVIMLENVEEFADWGPLTAEGRPCPTRKGQTFRQWLAQLRRLGYQVEHRMLRACDYGAPTIRRRLFLIARRDGRPIVWPKPSHGDPESTAVKRGRLKPWRTAAECIDWNIPAPSIFERKRPLAENTCKRIARGVVRYVLEAQEPFIVTYYGQQGDEFRGQSIQRPLATQTTENRHAIAVPTMIQTGYGERPGQAPRVPGLDKPLGTVVAGGSKHALVAAFLAKHYGGNYSGPGVGMTEPTGTVTTQDHHALVSAHVLNMKGSDRRMRSAEAPAPTICAGGNHAALVSAFMSTYYQNGSTFAAHSPTHTVTTKDRIQLVTCEIGGESYAITDIGMRMLQPRELFRAQGFPDTYVIDPVVNGKPLTKSAQVRMCGNSVPPVFPRALVSANFAHEQQIQGVA